MKKMSYRYLAAAIVTCLLVGVGVVTFMTDRNEKKKVIVVGAGISGLAAARDLHDRGHEVVVLEAKDYIGGRIKTEIIDGQKVELGASWIHGDIKNPVAKILTEEGIALAPTKFETSAGYKNGQRYEADEEQLETFSSYLDGLKSELDDDVSLQQVWDNFVSQNPDLSIAEQKDLYHLLKMNIETELGAGLSDISALQYEEEDELKGGDKIVVGGYDRVINKLASGLDVRLKTVVNRVEDTGSSVEVVATDGQKFTADKVIVTVPLGVLKKDTITFVPTFPTHKQLAVDSLDMGNLHKTFLTFSGKFWDDVDYISVFDDNQTKWADFINLEPILDTPTLLVLHAGADAVTLEGQTEQQLGEAAFKALKSAYPSATEPTKVVSSRWWADQYTLGSYSYVPPGATLEMYDDIAESYGNIHFAGEHTNSKYPSTTHGAYLSGIRAASEI